MGFLAGLFALGFQDTTPTDQRAYTIGVFAFAFVIIGIPLLLMALTMVLAARLKPGRPGTRTGVLVMEGVFGVLGVLAVLGSCVLLVRVPNAATAVLLIVAVLGNALPWTIFFCLVQDSARQYFG
jgi:hypothetical protein